MIFVDTNVIVDLIGRDPVWSDWSRQELEAASSTDQLAINDVVYAELSVGYSRYQDIDAFIARAGLALMQTPRQALFIAGKAFQRYRRGGGPRTGVLADFFIGAHAIVSDAKLLTRDPRRYRFYFPGIELITPSVN
jgi:predicted nucleic acid-binding protein